MTATIERMTPITLAPQSDVAPHRYVVIRHLQVCLHCATQHAWSDIYSETHLKSRLNAGKYVTNLRPVRTPSDIQYNIPVIVKAYETTRTPFCHECWDSVTLTHLPSPPPPKPEVINRFAGHDPYPNDKKPDAAKAAKPKTKPTIDDLSF